MIKNPNCYDDIHGQATDGHLEDAEPFADAMTETTRLAELFGRFCSKAATGKGNEFDAKAGCPVTYASEKIKIDQENLEQKRDHIKATNSAFTTPWTRRFWSIVLFILGFAVALISGGSWVRWIVLSTNDLLLAILLASMVPVMATALHYWVWRAKDDARDRALRVVTAGSALSGVALLIAVAWRFGLDAPISASSASALLAGDDNRAVMITADILGVCGSVLLMAWGDDLRKIELDRLRDISLQIARAKALVETHQRRRQVQVDRAVQHFHRTLIQAMSRIP